MTSLSPLLASALSYYSMQTLIALFCSGAVALMLGVVIGWLLWHGQRAKAESIESRNRELREEITDLERDAQA